MNENEILEQLKREALYAQCSFSTELLYQTYGKAQMARQFEALTQSEFMEISHMTVYFMNTEMNKQTDSCKQAVCDDKIAEMKMEEFNRLLLGYSKSPPRLKL